MMFYFVLLEWNLLNEGVGVFDLNSFKFIKQIFYKQNEERKGGFSRKHFFYWTSWKHHRGWIGDKINNNSRWGWLPLEGSRGLNSLPLQGRIRKRTRHSPPTWEPIQVPSWRTKSSSSIRLSSLQDEKRRKSYNNFCSFPHSRRGEWKLISL